MRLTRIQLYHRLRERALDPIEAALFDRRLWDELGIEATVLVSDLSGFTRQMRRHGVLHFLDVHRRSLELSGTVMQRFGGQLVKTEADNSIALLDRPETAVRAGLELLSLCRRANDGVAPDAQLRPCLGLCHGHILLLADDAFGEPVNLAYKLGEDVARPFELLIDEATARLIDADGFGFGPTEYAQTGGMTLAYRAIR